MAARILHAWRDLLGGRAPLQPRGWLAQLRDCRCRNRARADQCGNRRAHERQHLPLLRLSQHRRGHPRSGRGGPSMKPFSYQRASDVASACASAAQPTAKFIAGGTNLVDLMKLQIEAPAQLVDITRLPLTRIEETAEGGLRIGALVTNSAAAVELRVRRRYPLLAPAILSSESTQLSNTATTACNRNTSRRTPPF